MYETLTVKNHAGVVVALIESIDGSKRVKFATSRTLRSGLEEFMRYGLNVRRLVDLSTIRISASPEDSDFLEKLSFYLQLSFDYLPCYAQFESIPVNMTFTSQQIRYKEVEEPIYLQDFNNWLELMIGPREEVRVTANSPLVGYEWISDVHESQEETLSPVSASGWNSFEAMYR